jgi:hypothetical protein
MIRHAPRIPLLGPAQNDQRPSSRADQGERIEETRSSFGRSPSSFVRSPSSFLRSPTSPLRSPTSPLRSPTSPLRSPTSPLRSPTSPMRSPSSLLRSPTSLVPSPRSSPLAPTSRLPVPIGRAVVRPPPHDAPEEDARRSSSGRLHSTPGRRARRPAREVSADPNKILSNWNHSQ